MNKSYRTVGSSLFLNENKNHIPEWINTINIDSIEPIENINLQFQKQAAFNTMPKVCRDDRDFNSREVRTHLNDNGLILTAKVELAKFLSGYHYNVDAKHINGNIELTTKIINIPATFLFKYAVKNGTVKAAKLFNIDVDNGEYPFSKSGLNECIEDLKTGRIKTATKADAYTAYTITLEEVVRRFNGDQRAAMDKVRELVASKDIIGVGSNTFATCFAIDSLFPKMEKKGKINTVPTFEFVKNREHVAANINASAAILITAASNKLNSLFTDFRIKSFERNKDNLIVTADVLHNKVKKHLAFNFNIDDEQIKGIAYINDNGNNISLQSFLEETENSNVLQVFNKKIDKRLVDGIILKKSFIFNQLKEFISKENIQAIIDNWCERELIAIIDANTYMSKLSFTDLLNQVNTKLLTEDETNALFEYSARTLSYLDRIDMEDDIRDYNIVFSPIIRLTNLYNKLYKFLDKFKIKDINDDCTQVFITNFSERGPEDLTFFAKYNGNNCIDINTNSEKNITSSLNLYKQANKKNIFANSIFSESMLKQALQTVFKDYNFDNIKTRFNLQKVGNNFFASSYPVSAIINLMAQEKLATPLTSNERKNQLQQQARVTNEITRQHIQDVIRDSIDYSKSLRLASAYNKLSTKLAKFALVNANKNCSKLKVKIYDEQGIRNLVVQAKYKDNKCIDVDVADNLQLSEGLQLYKQANKNNVFAKSIFSKTMLLNLFSNIFKNAEQATDVVLTKIATNISNNFYASKYPLSTIIDQLSKHNYQVLNNEERKELLDIQAHFGKKVTANYEKDTRVRDGNVIISKSLRLANVYPFIANKYPNLHISAINDDATNIKLSSVSPIGLSKYSIDVVYNNNKPIQINDEIIDQVKEKEIVAKYYSRYGKNVKVAKSIFTKSMLTTLLKSFVKKDNLEKTANNILNQSEQLDSNYYANNKSLISLLNDNVDQVDTTYDLQKRIDEFVNRENVTDTGIRDIEFTDNLISMINKASLYLNKYFKDINFRNAFIDNGVLKYQCTLFDKDTGLKNNIDCLFKFNDNDIVDCKVNVNKKLTSIDKVKQAFTTNDILSKYIQYNKDNRVNAPVVISNRHLIDKLSNLTRKNKDELNEILSSWNEQGKITRIASNAYVSKYTVEQLLSMSSLKALTDDEIKQKLGKRHNLLKLSKAYIKDTGDRKIEQNWNLDQYIRFIHSELDKLSNYVKIFDANIDELNLNVTAEIGRQGVRHTINFNWDLDNNRPSNLQYILPEESPIVQKYINNNFSKNDFNINFTEEQLANKLYGYVDKNMLKKACKYLVEKDILTKNDNKYYSHYSIPELLSFIEKYGFINEDAVKKEIKLANRQEKIDITTYKMDDNSRVLRNDNKNEYMNIANQKLSKNIKLAMNNDLITKRKAKEWLDLLNNNENILRVHKEFTEYLRGK